MVSTHRTKVKVKVNETRANLGHQVLSPNNLGLFNGPSWRQSRCPSFLSSQFGPPTSPMYRNTHLSHVTNYNIQTAPCTIFVILSTHMYVYTPNGPLTPCLLSTKIADLSPNPPSHPIPTNRPSSSSSSSAFPPGPSAGACCKEWCAAAEPPPPPCPCSCCCCWPAMANGHTAPVGTGRGAPITAAEWCGGNA